MREFKYQRTTLREFGDIEGEIRERAVTGKRVSGPLNRIMNGRSVSGSEERIKGPHSPPNPDLCS